MIHFSIKDLSTFSGIKPHTIRMWEQRFTFLKPKRNGSLRRLYSTDELNTFLRVSLLNQSGYRVSRIARMTPDEKSFVLSRLNDLQGDLRLINELIICMAEMDTDRFEASLNGYFRKAGIHAAIRSVLLPFCERVGLLQKLDTRHYIENMMLVKEIVKRKLHLGIDDLPPAPPAAKTALLFLPPGEQQELGLLYLAYQAKEAGLNPVYLGRHATVDMLEGICSVLSPAYLLTYLLEKHPRHDLVRFADKLPETVPGAFLITFGQPLATLASNKAYRHADSLQQLAGLLRI